MQYQMVRSLGMRIFFQQRWVKWTRASRSQSPVHGAHEGVKLAIRSDSFFRPEVWEQFWLRLTWKPSLQTAGSFLDHQANKGGGLCSHKRPSNISWMDPEAIFTKPWSWQQSSWWGMKNMTIIRQRNGRSRLEADHPRRSEKTSTLGICRFQQA